MNQNNFSKIFLIIIVVVLIGGFGYYTFLKIGTKNSGGYVGCSSAPEGLPWVARIFGQTVFASPPTLSPQFVTKSRLCFVDNPTLNKPVEIVYEFKRGSESSSPGDLISATATIQIPEGFEIVSGSSTWTGTLAEGKTGKLSIMVKPIKMGYFRFKSLIMIGTFTGSASVLWVEVSPQNGKVGNKPQDMWNKNGGVYESSDPFSKNDNPFRFQSGNFNKGHDANIISTLELSNPLAIGKESILTYSITPKIDLPNKTKISLQFPENAFEIIDVGNSQNEKVMQNDNTKFIVWTGPIKKEQKTEVYIRLKLKNYGWGNISAKIQIWKDPGEATNGSYLSLDDETVLNLYLDKYGKYASVLGDDLKSFNLSELHQIK